MSQRRLLFVLLIPMLALTIASAQSAEHRFASALRIALSSDIRSTDAGVLRDSNTDVVMHHMLEPLVTYGENLDIVPILAESFTITEDQKSYIFVLRENLTFHNGQPVTANDVKWSWDRYLDPDTGWLCRRTLVEDPANPNAGTIIESIAVIDDRSIKFDLRFPSALFLHHIASIQCIGGIIHPDSVTESGEWREPIGTGPYRLKEWRRGEFIDLQRFEYYSIRGQSRNGLGGAKFPYAETVRFQVVPDAFAAKAMLVSGAIDVLPNLSASSRLEIESQESLRLLSQPSPAWNVLLMQTEDELLSDLRIRQAIAHAIDIAVVAEAASFGSAIANPSAVPVQSGFHSDIHDQWLEYDPLRSRELLEQAGYEGEEVILQTNRRFRAMFDQAIAVQAMLHAVGINASLQVLDWATHLSNYFNGRFQLSSFGYSPRTDPTLAYAMFVGSKSENKYIQWDSREAATLVSRSENILDTEERQKAFDELHGGMQTEIPIIGLFNANAYQVVRKSICGYESWSLLLPRAWGVWKSDDCGHSDDASP